MALYKYKPNPHYLRIGTIVIQTELPEAEILEAIQPQPKKGNFKNEIFPVKTTPFYDLVPIYSIERYVNSGKFMKTKLCLGPASFKYALPKASHPYRHGKRSVRGFCTEPDIPRLKEAISAIITKEQAPPTKHEQIKIAMKGGDTRLAYDLLKQLYDG